MTRLAMDGVDLFIVEHGCAANIKVTRNSLLCVVFSVKLIIIFFFLSDSAYVTPGQFINSRCV